jgi:formate--tetrahydrofolate ligase
VNPSPAAAAEPASPQPIRDIALRLGLLDDECELYGTCMAKIQAPAILDRLKNRAHGRSVAVTGMTPTTASDGVAATSVGLSMAINELGRSAVGCLRQPPMSELFSHTAASSSAAVRHVLPAEPINPHLTGDSHAVMLAHNLLAAALDNELAHGNRLDLDRTAMTWPRVLDVGDAALRHVLIGIGRDAGGYPRETRFDTVADSEIMTMLALVQSLAELRTRLGAITVGYSRDREPIVAEKLGIAGAMAVLLKDALLPNLLQTTNYSPLLVHGGPSASLGLGSSSVLADLTALALADYAVSEAGCGTDLGLEKLVDIKARTTGVVPDLVVVVCSVLGIKLHSATFRASGAQLTEFEPAGLEAGAANLCKHIANVLRFDLPVAVAIERHPTDADWELGRIQQVALDAGAEGVAVVDPLQPGAGGYAALGRVVLDIAEFTPRYDGRAEPFLYALTASIKQKIEAIGSKMYGAAKVVYSGEAERQIKRYTQLGWDALPVCMAKTPLSFSDDSSLKGRPENFELTVREVAAWTGAGLLCPRTDGVEPMPGPPEDAAFQRISLDEQGRVVGLL